MTFRIRPRHLVAALALCVTPAVAFTPQDLAQQLAEAARAQDAHFAGFSAQRGQAFFNATHRNEWSCASCHSSNPIAPGRHARTGKSIEPLAPAANAQRFTDAQQVEKWFRRNCGDVVGRPCTANEKGDVLAFLLSLGRGSR